MRKTDWHWVGLVWKKCTLSKLPNITGLTNLVIHKQIIQQQNVLSLFCTQAV